MMQILFIQLKQLGDVLMTTPLLKALKKVQPGASIHFLANRGSARAVEAHPLLDRVIRFDDKCFIRQALSLRNAGYDVVVDCMGTPKTALVSFLSGAKMRIGFKKRGRSCFYTHPIPISPEPVYSVLEKALLLSPLGVTVQDPLPELPVFPQDEAEAATLVRDLKLKEQGKVIAFAPTSRRAYKMWPLSSYAQACDILFEKYRIKFLPLFGPGEETMVEEVISQSKYPGAFIFPYAPPSFRALKGLIRECCFYFGNDNGIRHIAIAAGIPTAALFSRINPVVWTPPGFPQHRSLWGKAGIETIHIDDVINMIKQVFNEIPAV